VNSQFATVKFLCLFYLLVTCIGRTGGPILTIYTSYDVLPRKDVPFGGSVDIRPPRLPIVREIFKLSYY